MPGVKAARIGLRADKTVTDNDLNNTAVSQIPTWFERKFEFTFPVEHYLILCVRCVVLPRAGLSRMASGIDDRLHRL